MHSNPDLKPTVLNKAGGIDAGLLLTRMEARLLKADPSDETLALLRKPSIWRRFGPEDRLRWADLAQMAGDMETTCRILESLNQEFPSLSAAWQRHLELLGILGRDTDRAALLARARPHIGETAARQWGEPPPVLTAAEEKDMLAAASPFHRHHDRMAALKRFMTLFAGREDCFARQWADRGRKKSGYVPERRPLTPDDLEEHFNGRKTFGIYLMQADGNIRTAVIDADLKKALRGSTVRRQALQQIRREAVHMITRIREISRSAGAVPLVEFSGGKGYHFWYFFEQPQACAPVRAALFAIVGQVLPDLTAFNLEVFPKQDHPGGKGFGNLVKLPLGVHRATGKRSYFMDCRDRRVDAQLNLLLTTDYAPARTMTERLTAEESAEVVVHPRWKAWADTYPDLYQLQRTCAPLAQVMSLCLDGGSLSIREEKILYQTIGFLADGPRLLHYLLGGLPDYNRHQVDYRLSRLRGTPLGCRRIHELLTFSGSICSFERQAAYPHPLLQIDGWQEPSSVPPSEKVVDLTSALDHLQTAITQVQRLLK